MTAAKQKPKNEVIYLDQCAHHQYMAADVQRSLAVSTQIDASITQWREEMLSSYVTKEDLKAEFGNFKNALVAEQNFVTKHDLKNAFKEFKDELIQSQKKSFSDDRLYRIIEILIAALLAIMGVKYIPLP